MEKLEQEIRDLKVVISFLLYRDANTPADELLLEESVKRLGIRKGATQRPSL